MALILKKLCIYTFIHPQNQITFIKFQTANRSRAQFRMEAVSFNIEQPFVSINYYALLTVTQDPPTSTGTMLLLSIIAG